MNQQDKDRLRELAGSASEWDVQSYRDYYAHATPSAILSLLEENEALARDAARWRYSTAYGGNQTMNWLDVYDDWDGDGYFADAIDAAMKEDGGMS